MDKLSFGDQIKSGPGEYSTVFMFDHKADDVVADFVKLSFSDETFIKMTSSHSTYSDGFRISHGWKPRRRIKIYRRVDSSIFYFSSEGDGTI